MLTEPGAERKAFEEQESMCQHVRDYTKIKARREVIRRHKAQFLDGVPQEQFERLLADCERDADEIAREATAEASSQISGTELSMAAYEVAYIEAYADALPALVATALARCKVLDQAA